MFIDVEYRGSVRVTGTTSAMDSFKGFYAATLQIDRFCQFTAYGDSSEEAVGKLPDMLQLLLSKGQA